MRKYLDRIVENRRELDKFEGIGGSPNWPLGKANFKKNNSYKTHPRDLIKNIPNIIIKYQRNLLKNMNEYQTSVFG